MWLVEKTTTPTRQDRRKVTPAARQALMKVWDGSATEPDIALTRALIERASSCSRWIACDCRRPADGEQALMAPAYLRTHRTHYLRRLYGKTRLRHDDRCPFYGEPALGNDRLIEHVVPNMPDGYFAIDDRDMRPKANLSVLGINERDDGPRIADSLLRRQLWRLMTRARLHVIEPPVRGRQPSYKFEYAALRDAADELHVTYGVPLSRVFETVPTAIERKSIYAKIRQEAAKRRSDVAGYQSDPLQGWVCTFARDALPDAVRASMGDRHVLIQPERGVDVLPGGGPYLVLVCIAPNEKGALRPVRAIAQPILGMRRFYPIYSAAERPVIEDLVSLQYDVGREHEHLALGFERSLFGQDGDAAPGRLACLLTDDRTGALHELSFPAARLAGPDSGTLVDIVRAWIEETEAQGASTAATEHARRGDLAAV